MTNGGLATSAKDDFQTADDDGNGWTTRLPPTSDAARRTRRLWPDFPGGPRSSTLILASGDDLAGAETRIVTTHESMSHLAVRDPPWIIMAEWHFHLGGRKILLDEYSLVDRIPLWIRPTLPLQG